MPSDSSHPHLHHHHHLTGVHHDHAGALSPHHHHHHAIDTGSCATTTANDHHHHHHSSDLSIDLVTTLRSELAALSYKRDRLSNELADAKSVLCAKESECESLRAQAARQTALIGSLQGRLQAAENREHSVQTRCDSTIQTIQREKRSADERSKELQCKIQHLESHLLAEETQREQLKAQLHDLLRRLAGCLGIDSCGGDAAMSTTADCVVARVEELTTELQRSKAKVASTCDTLASCENELLNLKSLANIEKQRLSAQLEGASSHSHELEGRCRQYERDLQLARDRLTESEIGAEKLKEELRGFESRCHRLQNNLDRSQSDRLQFLRCLASQLGVAEPCETLIKDKLRETIADGQSMHAKLHSLQEQVSSQQEKLKHTQESTQCRLRTEEAQKSELEERLEKCHAEIHTLRKDHLGLSEYLQRLARALCWAECSTPPALGTDTNIMAESLLERAERLAAHHEHHGHELVTSSGHLHDHHGHHHHGTDKGCLDHHHHHLTLSKLRRERSCHDIPLKESSSVYNLQRRVRILREQVQRRDLHLELLRRKLAIIEDGARGKCVLQGERDDAVCRAKKASRQIDKLTAQLVDARSQIAEVKAQLAEAVEYKITSLERARKIDDLTTQICHLEEEKTRLLAQLGASKERLKASSESAQNRRCRDEALINSLREDLSRLQSQLSDTNQSLSHLQSFRTSVARTLHLRDLPETDLLHRLQALCTAHQEFTLLSKRYEAASPVGEHPCPRYDDPVPPSAHCRPPAPCDDESPSKFSHGHGTNSHSLGHGHNLGTNGLGLGLGHDHSHGHRHGHDHAHSHHHSDDHHRHRSKSRGREKRLHDECFETDVHRVHCDDDFEFKSKFC